MAKNPQDIISRFADLGEEALQRLPNVPGGNKLMDMVNQSRTRLDDVQKRLRGLDLLEQRVDELEQRLARLETKSTTKKAAAKTRKPATPKPATPKPAAPKSAAPKPAAPDEPAS